MDKVYFDIREKSVHVFCSNCDKEMIFTGNSLLSNPPQYIHCCIGCGRKYLSDFIYPIKGRSFNNESV